MTTFISSEAEETCVDIGEFGDNFLTEGEIKSNASYINNS